MKNLIVCMLLVSSALLGGCDYFLAALMEGKPVVAPTTMPSEKIEFITPDRHTISIIIYGNDNIFCFEGDNISKGKSVSYSGNNSIGLFLQTKQRQLGKKLQVYIKATPDCAYKNTVNMLDQLTIYHIKKYALVDPSERETEFVSNLTE